MKNSSDCQIALGRPIWQFSEIFSSNYFQIGQHVVLSHILIHNSLKSDGRSCYMDIYKQRKLKGERTSTNNLWNNYLPKIIPSPQDTFWEFPRWMKSDLPFLLSVSFHLWCFKYKKSDERLGVWQHHTFISYF